MPPSEFEDSDLKPCIVMSVPTLILLKAFMSGFKRTAGGDDEDMDGDDLATDVLVAVGSLPSSLFDEE